MLLSDLLKDIDYELLNGRIDTDISSFVLDSRKASKGSLFICIKGAVSDGHAYAPDVISKGAGAVIIEHEIDMTDIPKDTAIVKVEDTRKACALMSAAWFGHPADKLRTIGITGTKGKTTTSYMIKSALESCGHKVGLIGTIETIIGDEHIPAHNTTPESYDIHRFFDMMVKAGMDTVVMEVSSQGLMLHRTYGIEFDIGVFTNLGLDHIGEHEHKDFNDYLNCKARLFRQCRTGIGNIDDEYYSKIFKDATCNRVTFGLGLDADVRGENMKLLKKPGLLGVSLDITGSDSFHVDVDIPGRFSVYNSLCCIAVCLEMGIPHERISEALGKIKVKGRVELINTNDDYILMIDYAHNAMALESLLTTIREYEPERIVTLFGCGGDRSKDRRFKMGEVAARLSDLTIITSDNPRTEDPQAIVDDIKTGFNRIGGDYVEILNRVEAIEYAIRNAKKGDVIILAGKGHEDYQEINGVRYDMDERVIVYEILRSYR